MTRELGGKRPLVGDDPLHHYRASGQGYRASAGNAISIAGIQIGSVSETLEAIKMAPQGRSGGHPFTIADLAVALEHLPDQDRCSQPYRAQAVKQNQLPLRSSWRQRRLPRHGSLQRKAP